jgi:CBS domain-containing protein
MPVKTARKPAAKRASGKTRRPAKPGKPVLGEATAERLMTTNPVSIRRTASTDEAAALFTERRISAAPVIDEAGRPVGVVSRSDLVRYVRERAEYGAEAEYFAPSDPEEDRRDGQEASMRPGPLAVSAVMTPRVYSVGRRSPAAQVVREMLDKNVHRLFVVDDDGVLVGVISALDLVRHLSTGNG